MSASPAPLGYPPTLSRQLRGDGPQRSAASAVTKFIGGSWGMPVLVGTVSSRHPGPRFEADAYLAECRSQKAGAKQHEAGRCEGKKSVGDNVVVAHVTPTTQMLVRIY